MRTFVAFTPILYLDFSRSQKEDSARPFCGVTLLRVMAPTGGSNLFELSGEISGVGGYRFGIDEFAESCQSDN